VLIADLPLSGLEVGAQFVARSIESGVSGLERATEGLGHFFHGELLQLEEDEDVPLIVAELIERTTEAP
jgi:hypothetical protein